MLTKLATFPGRSADGEPLVRVFHRGDSVKRAADGMMPEVRDWLSAYRPEPGKIAALVNALGASEWYGANSNGDRFRWEALAHDCRQHEAQPHPVDEFIGRPVPAYGAWTFRDAGLYSHHRNKQRDRAFGDVQLVVLNPRMKRVELIVLLDREKARLEGAQDVVERVDAGEPTEVSMGTRVPYDVAICCGRKARTRDGYCFPPGILVTMADGTPKPIEEVRAKDLVLSAKGCATRVVQTFEHVVDEDLVVIRHSLNGILLRATADHPIFSSPREDWSCYYKMHNANSSNCQPGSMDICEDCRKTFPAMQEIPADELRVNDALYGPAVLPSGQSCLEENDQELHYLLGLFMAEGCYAKQRGKRTSAEFSFHEDETDLLEKVRKFALRYGREMRVYHNSYGRGVSARVNSGEAAAFLYDHVGEYAHEKRASQDIVNLHNEGLEAYLRGLWDGDGHVSPTKGGYSRLNTASLALAWQTAGLLRRLGYTVYFGRAMTPGGPSNRTNKFTQWYVNTDFGTDRSKRRGIIGTTQIGHVLETSREPYKGPVYNFETEDHSYVAGGVAVHNCSHIKQHGLGFMLPDGRMIEVDNPHPRFFDLSFVFIGADKTARVMCKLASGIYVPRSVLDAELLYGRTPAEDEPMLVKAASRSPSSTPDGQRTYEVLGAQRAVDHTDGLKTASEWARRHLQRLADRSGKSVDYWLRFDPRARHAASRLPLVDQRAGPQDGLLATNSGDASDMKLAGLERRTTLDAVKQAEPNFDETPRSIHEYAYNLGFKDEDIDDNKSFMDVCEKFTGERHLDKMTPRQLQDVASFLPSYARLHASGSEKAAWFHGFLGRMADSPRRMITQAGRQFSEGAAPTLQQKLIETTRAASTETANRVRSALRAAGRTLSSSAAGGALAGGTTSALRGEDAGSGALAGAAGGVIGGGLGASWLGMRALPVGAGALLGGSLLGFKPLRDSLTQPMVVIAEPEKTAGVKIGPPPSPNRSEFPFVGTIDFRGLKINVENKPGDVREGTGPGGKKWRTVMKLPYGEFVGARGADKDRLDVYVGPDESSDQVFAVHQNHPKGHPRAGEYDEDKIFVGMKSADDAKKAYLAHYDDPSFFRSITQMSFDQFKRAAFPNRAGEKIATGLSLDDLFVGAATAERRERSWRDAVSGLKTEHRGSGLGTSFQNMQKTADAKRAADKRATQVKDAEIDKELPPEDAVGQVSKLLTGSEPPMDRPLLDELAAHPLEKALSTCSLMGIPLHPAEFQRLVLVRAGGRPLADGLDDRGIVFGPQDEEQCACQELGAQHFTNGIMRSLLPLLEQRSYLGPVLRRRLTVVVMSPRLKPEAPDSELKTAALLTKLGRLYNWYRGQMIKVAMGAQQVVDKQPELSRRLAVGDDHQLFATKQASAPVVAAISAVPLTLMYAAGLREREARGEPLGIAGQAVAHHPWLASIGAAAGVRQLMRHPAISEFTRGVGQEVSTLGRRLTSGAREVVPPR